MMDYDWKPVPIDDPDEPRHRLIPEQRYQELAARIAELEAENRRLRRELDTLLRHGIGVAGVADRV